VTGKTLGPKPVRLNDQVNALAIDGGRMYVGGWFFLVNPHAADGLASLDAKTLAVTDEVTKRPPGTGPRRSNGSVMLPGADRLLFAETNFHGYRKPPLDPWAPTSSRVRAVDTSSGDYLRRYGLDRLQDMSGIAVGGNRVYVAQRLQDDVRFPHNRISVRSLRTGKEIDSFDLPLRGYVTKLDYGSGSLFAGGSFRRFRPDGTPAHLAVIRVDPRNGSLRGRFDPHVNGPVYDIEVDDGRVYSVGLFDKAGPKIPPRGLGDGRAPLERRGLEAADVADGSPIRTFAPRGNRHSDLYRLRAVAGCLDAAIPFGYTDYSHLLSQATGLSCRGAGLPLYPGNTTAAVGRIAFTGSGYSFAQDTLEFVTLVSSP
jgi:hypothetical protein